MTTAAMTAGVALEASEQQATVEKIRKQYFWLYIPFGSWIALVFPLILPPIPIGPIVVSLAWNRRDWMSFLRRGMAHIGRKPKELQFPTGWLVNVGVNLADIFTLGLTHLFVTAGLLDAMIAKHGTKAEKAQTGAVLWVVKWLFLGNVVFIAVYILCPGLIFERLLARFESHLYNQYQPISGEVRSSTSSDKRLTYSSAMTFEELSALSRQCPVLLFAENMPVEAERAAAKVFHGALGGLAANLVDAGVAVRWCNLNQAAPSRYSKLIAALSDHNVARRGWTLIGDGQIAAHRDVGPVTTVTDQKAHEQRLARLARETLGLPQAAMLSPERLASPDRHVRTLAEAAQLATQAEPVVLVTFHAATPAEQDQRVLEIRTDLLPRIRRALEAAGARFCLANTHKKHGDPIRDELRQLGLKKNFRGAALLRGGAITAHKSFGALATWYVYAEQIRDWLGCSLRESGETVEAQYYIVASTAESLARADGGPALLVTGGFPWEAGGSDEFHNKILPDVWPYAESLNVPVCVWDTSGSAGGCGLDGGGIPPRGVAVLSRGGIVEARRVEETQANAVRYVAAARELLGRIAPPEH